MKGLPSQSAWELFFDSRGGRVSWHRTGGLDFELIQLVAGPCDRSNAACGEGEEAGALCEPSPLDSGAEGPAASDVSIELISGGAFWAAGTGRTTALTCTMKAAFVRRSGAGLAATARVLEVTGGMRLDSRGFTESVLTSSRRLVGGTCGVNIKDFASGNRLSWLVRPGVGS